MLNKQSIFQKTSFMQQALRHAEKAFKLEEVPVGAVLVDFTTQKIIATAHNMSLKKNNPLLHAEMIVLQKGLRKFKIPYLSKCDLYVTLEPCSLCASAISMLRIRRLYFGAYDPKSGGVEHGACVFSHPTCHHKPEIYGGICEKDSALLLKTFFQGKRL
jgi:tRNA(adenine34) deaminase